MDTKSIDSADRIVERLVEVVGELLHLALTLEAEGLPEAVMQLRQAAQHASRAAAHVLPLSRHGSAGS